MDAQINKLQSFRSTLQRDRAALISSLKARQTASARHLLPSTRGAAKPKGAIDYTKSSFDWSAKALETARTVFGIQAFRLCQEAAINASVDGRELVCVMPTGTRVFYSIYQAAG